MTATTLNKNTEVKSTPTIIVSPKMILQGDPVMISVNNLTLTDIKSGTIGKSKLSFFNYKNMPTALYGCLLYTSPSPRD